MPRLPCLTSATPRVLRLNQLWLSAPAKPFNAAVSTPSYAAPAFPSRARLCDDGPSLPITSLPGRASSRYANPRQDNLDSLRLPRR